jgi:hypothetical protein
MRVGTYKNDHPCHGERSAATGTYKKYDIMKRVPPNGAQQWSADYSIGSSSSYRSPYFCNDTAKHKHHTRSTVRFKRKSDG